MYRDTEQSYRGWTLDVYQLEDQDHGAWYCDYWKLCAAGGSVSSRRRRDAVAEAKRWIDRIVAAKLTKAK